MRKRFGNWGIELSEEEFACALAALGMLPRLAEPSWPTEELAATIASRLRRSVPWRLLPEYQQFEPRLLARVWLLALSIAGRRASLHIDPSGLSPLSPDWVKSQLSRRTVGAASVKIAVRLTKPPALKEEGSYSIDEMSTQGGSMPELDPGWRSLAEKAVKGVVVVEGPEPRARFLQAHLEHQGGITYIASIRVGLPDQRWQSVEERFPLPEDAGSKGHRLTVLFWEPRVSPKPQAAELWLPPRGDSQTVSFTFEVPRSVKSISARVTVLHANRVLQTGLLQAEVGRGIHWTFRIDAAPRKDLESLADRSPFDLALVLAGETPHLIASSEDQTVALALDDGPVGELTDLLDRQISAIAKDPDRYAGLESLGSIELLRSLAQVGAVVHDHLQQHSHLDRLADARRIHITSAKAGAFLPIEFLYRFRPPEPTAGLCPHALASLETGDCSGACPSDKRKAVCPLGFWGLSRVIERHSHLPEDQDRISKDFEIGAEPARGRSRLPLSKTSLLAASSRASGEMKDAITSLLAKLKARGASMLASTWPEWEHHIASDLPGLLVLLPHHERRDGFEILAIGEDERLASVNIWDEVVRKLPDGPHPIVLLMGCETNLTRISFDSPVSRFRDRGAALVVSTIATILGRHASPATATLVDLLDEMSVSGNRTFGEVMLRLRQRLVLFQTPMALGLTVYGDADWVLTRENR